MRPSFLVANSLRWPEEMNSKVRYYVNPGKDFEQQWKDSVPDDILIQRMPDPAQSFQKNAMRFSPHNPYDFFMFYSPNLFCLELKSTKSPSFTFCRKDFSERKSDFNIKKHQIEGLEAASAYEHVIAGFVLNFRKVNHTYFIPIQRFKELIENTPKKSINEADVVENGAYLISQTLKKTKFKFDVKKFVEDMSTIQSVVEGKND